MASPGAIQRVKDAFVVQARARIRRGLRVPVGHDLVVGPGGHIGGDVVGARSVYLAKGSRVSGDIDAGLDVVVGAAVRVGGRITAGGNVQLLEGSIVHGHVKASGRARIIGASLPRGLEAAGDVEVRGKSDLSLIRAGGRIVALPAPTQPEAR